ncbi:MAG: alpha-L-rhamnosidase, partial [Lachnospiraceae bacterium]|nr:alpha-L-rhamnosidase [Lachnospiraceae bacterium]
PAQDEEKQYSMYSDPYGKSLCHAWGASPVYLLGKYFLGVKPASPGYKSWTADPAPGFFKELDACVPLPEGRVHIVLKNGEFTSEYVPDTEE